MLYQPVLLDLVILADRLLLLDLPDQLVLVILYLLVLVVLLDLEDLSLPLLMLYQLDLSVLEAPLDPEDP
jgi:hypothetical protein